MDAVLAPLKRWPSQQPLLFLLLAAAAWFGLYQTLNPAAEALVAALPVERDSHLGGAPQFFLYDTPKVLPPWPKKRGSRSIAPVREDATPRGPDDC